MESVLCALGKNVYSAVGRNVLYLLGPFCLNCSSGPVFSLLIFCFYFVYLELCQELRIMSSWNRVAYEYPVQILMCFASGTYVLRDSLYIGHLQGFLH